MRQKVKLIQQYIPWLLLLLGIDIFAAFSLWIADVQAFYAMITVTLLSSVLLFSSVCGVLVHREEKRKQAFLAFLNKPDEYQEELLIENLCPAQRESVRLLGRTLRNKQTAYDSLQMQIDDYEEYVESWAHETKTPLSLLTLLLDNRRDELPAAMDSKLDHIRNRMQESIDQILFYARLKSTRKDYLFEPVHILSCIEEVLEDYKPLLEEKQFQIQFCMSDDTVYTDQRGLRFLLRQIISNSIKYCRNEPELNFNSFEAENRYVFVIKDNGIGVRSCDLPFLFEKGFTGDSGKERKKATGMGLYLAKEMAGDLNITLQVNSEWGKGFEIRIFFPLVDSVAEFRQNSHPAPPAQPFDADLS